jgi:hypothetical protein
MGRTDLFVQYALIGGLLLLTLHFIRIRLEKRHPDLFNQLGRPKFQDSNLGSTYWRFQAFVWWRHFSVRTDIVLNSLCLAACLFEVMIFVLFFFVI